MCLPLTNGVSALGKSLRKQIEEREGIHFPSNSYTKLVLEPAYDEAKIHFLEHLLQINYAHLIMLVEQGIVTKQDGIAISKALRNIKQKDVQTSSYNPQFEDLFFQIEYFLVETAGDVAGNLHIAKSRNDMGIAIYRMTLREKLLSVIEEALRFRQSLIELTEEHKDTIMIGYTHTQQAQPTTLSHYLNAMTDVITRDITRLSAAYDNVNKSSMGAAALTTSGFHINRKLVQELLGFEGLIENAWDAVSGADYLTETATTIQLAALHLGRSVQDFLLWGTQEFGAFKLAEPYVQISSIMPQKRNPVSLEHTRALLSSIVGDTQTIVSMVHNTPFGDIVDTEDNIQPYIWRAIEKLEGIYRLISSILITMTVDKEKLLHRAKDSFANVTELADMLVRVDHFSFRHAHEIVSNSVKEVLKSGKETISDLTLQIINKECEKTVGKKSSLTEDQFNQAVSPEHFVHIRTIEGGPSPTRMKVAIEKRMEEQKYWEEWLVQKKQIKSAAQNRVLKKIDEWVL